MHRLEERYFRYGQVGSASLVSIAHGTNDAQKTMGVMTLALIASGALDQHDLHPGLGQVQLPRPPSPPVPTSAGGGSSAPSGRAWSTSPLARACRATVPPPPSCSRPATSASPCRPRTWPPARCSVVASAAAPGALVDAGRMVTAWATTFPIAALMGAVMWWIGDTVGGAAGATVVFLHPLRRLDLDLPQLAPRAGQRRQRQRLVGPRRRDHLPGLRARTGHPRVERVRPGRPQRVAGPNGAPARTGPAGRTGPAAQRGHPAERRRRP